MFFMYDANPAIFAGFGVSRPSRPLSKVDALAEEYQFLRGLAADIVYYGDESADYAGIMNRMEQVHRQILAIAPLWKP